ncbi:MAG: PAAR domain-containing protein [Acidobacteriota bacterium]|nr:PAAR domain-containing protein [Acidobacteriota bacterium]
MLAAARLGDKITHTEQRSGLIGGMILGALVGALLVAGTIATVLTGGLALAPILLIVGAVATGAAVGGGIFSFLGSLSTVERGAIDTAATTVFVNSRATPAARSCVDTAACLDHAVQKIMSGAATVYVEGFPFARVTDIGMCSFKIGKGSPNVFIGEATAACPGYENIMPEVEPWLSNLHRVLGWVGGLCLMGPIYGLRVAVASLIGGELGAYGGGELGEYLGGKWGRVAGSLLGGIIGGGIPLHPKVASFINRLEIDPNVLGTAGGNLRLKPKMEVGEVNTYGRLKNKTGEGLFDRDHQPSNGALKTRAQELNGGDPLSPTQARRIQNEAQAVAVPQDIHRAGPTYGGKNTPALQSSDASDLAGAARRDASTMVDNARQLDPDNLPTYQQSANEMTTMTNEQYDDWLRGILRDP